MSERPQSPCDNICILDPSGRYCTSCRRTTEEIARWGAMSDEEKQAVLDELPGRATAGGDAR